MQSDIDSAIFCSQWSDIVPVIIILELRTVFMPLSEVSGGVREVHLMNKEQRQAAADLKNKSLKLNNLD